jgi:hypothetical protein
MDTKKIIGHVIKRKYHYGICFLLGIPVLQAQRPAEPGNSLRQISFPRFLINSLKALPLGLHVRSMNNVSAANEQHEVMDNGEAETMLLYRAVTHPHPPSIVES